MINHPLRILISSLLATHKFGLAVELQDELRIRGYEIDLNELAIIVRDLANESSKTGTTNETESETLSEPTKVEIMESSEVEEPSFEDDFEEYATPVQMEIWDFEVPDDDFFDAEVNSEHVRRQIEDLDLSRISDPEIVKQTAMRLGLQGLDIKKYAWIVATSECYDEICEFVDNGGGLNWQVGPNNYPDLRRRLDGYNDPESFDERY